MGSLSSCLKLQSTDRIRLGKPDFRKLNSMQIEDGLGKNHCSETFARNVGDTVEVKASWLGSSVCKDHCWVGRMNC